MCCLTLRLTVNATYRICCTTACGSLLFFGLLVHLVAIVVPTWAMEQTGRHSPFEGVGLWRWCRWDETVKDINCTSLIANTSNPGWLTAVQVTQALSVALLLGALMAVFVTRNRSYSHLQSPIYGLLGLNISGMFAVLLGVAVFGVATNTSSGGYLSGYLLGWGFYLDVMALVIFCLPPVFSSYVLAIVTKYPHSELYPGSRLYV